jgi:hypothetical protein
LTDVVVKDDTVAATVAEEAALIESALLGYAKVDFLLLNVEFGQWNIRKVESSEVRGLADSMRTGRGLIRYTTKTMVPLVVRPGQVATDELLPDPGKGGDILPFLNVLDKSNTIFAAGGQHRRQALELWAQDLTKSIIALTAKIETTKEVSDTARLQEEVDSAKRELKGLGYWGVAIYDYGVSLTVYHAASDSRSLIDKCITNNNRIANIISRNDDLRRLGETKEEWFVGLIRDLVTAIGDGAITEEAHEAFWEAAKKKQTMYGEVVAQRPIVEMLVKSWPLRRYYAETDLYKPVALRKWVGVSGAVSRVL